MCAAADGTVRHGSRRLELFGFSFAGVNDPSRWRRSRGCGAFSHASSIIERSEVFPGFSSGGLDLVVHPKSSPPQFFFFPLRS